MKFSNILKHLNLIIKHKWVVFKLTVKVGIPWRGLVHDLSKFSPTEFVESVKYYNGKKSPLVIAKNKEGYSNAWLHHKGRNKHHAQYWHDESAPEKNALIPYKYAAEMICDKIAAGMVYEGKNFKNDTELKYYMNERKTIEINPKIDKFVIEVFTQVSEKGVKEVLNGKNIREIYYKNVNK